MTKSESRPVTLHRGSCHCGAVRIEAKLDLAAGVGECNCSICLKIGASSVIVKPDAFRLLEGAESITEYRARAGSPNFRSFCRKCGIHVFGQGDVPEIGGAFVSVNARCLEGVELAGLPEHHMDGRHDNWMAGVRPSAWPVLP